MTALLDPLRRILPAGWKRPLKRRFGIPETKLNADWSVLAPAGPCTRPHTILDIGAHSGWFLHCWLDWCPEATVHAFEPYPESYQTAQRLYGSDSRVSIHPVGIGSEEGKLQFNVLTESRVSNSFLQPDPKVWDRVAYRTGAVEKLEVPVTTIDQFCREHNLDEIYLIKIDVQGYELEVLKGAEQNLANIDYIFVESGIQRLYKQAPRFTEVFEFLNDRGFHLMSWRSWHRGNHVLMETDMLFRRDGLEGPVDEEINRIVVGS